jgi:hypothetical protein
VKLHLPEILHHMEKKPLVFTPAIGDPFIADAKDKRRNRFLTFLTERMHKATKFIFDSGSDQDGETVSAVRETSVNMLEAGFFHLPFPVIWIEDPFEDTPDVGFTFNKTTEMRNYYLATEDEDTITVFLIQRLPMEPRFMVHMAPLVIDLKEASDLFRLGGIDQQPGPILVQTYGEAIYALKKFLVVLATEDLVRENVEGKPWKASLPKLHRQYPFSVVRVPLERSGAGEALVGADGRKRRRGLVRGYMWGRNTRPLEEQRWIKPHWRGSQELGTVERSHYTVR